MNFSSPMHILLILLVVVLLFGGRKIPELMKGIGEGMREFKKASKLDDVGQGAVIHNDSPLQKSELKWS